jgi:hypothetical protein
MRSFVHPTFPVVKRRLRQGMPLSLWLSEWIAVGETFVLYTIDFYQGYLCRDKI